MLPLYAHRLASVHDLSCKVLLSLNLPVNEEDEEKQGDLDEGYLRMM